MVDEEFEDVAVARAGFWSDLTASAVACLSTPTLLLMAAFAAAVPVTLQIVAVDSGRTILLWVGVIIGLGLTGFSGAKRVWLMYVFGGRRVSTSEAFDLTFRYFTRFFALGFLTGLVSIPIFFWIDYVDIQAVRNGESSPTWTKWLLLGGILLVDVAYTFVTPELTLQSTTASRSIKSGIGLLVRTFRQSWPYVLTPGLAVLVSGSLLGGAVDNVWIAAVWTAVAAVISLIFAGAILRFYLRLRPISEPWLAPAPVAVPTPPEVVQPQATHREHSATNAAGEWNIEAFRAAGWTDAQLKAVGWFDAALETGSPTADDDTR